MDYTKVSVPAPLAVRAANLITGRPELGYRSVSELVTDHLRRFCEANEVHPVEEEHANGTSHATHANGVLSTAPRRPLTAGASDHS